MIHYSNVSKFLENNLFYADRTLPDEVDELHQFHLDCYRKFTAVKSKYSSEAATSTNRYVY